MGIRALPVRPPSKKPRRLDMLKRFPSVLPKIREMGSLLAEDSFLRMLCLERKRSERSRKPFMLMLVDGARPSAAKREIGLQRLAGVISASIRETDILGWYRDKVALGVLFTEIGHTDRGVLVQRLLAKLSTGLRTESGEPPVEEMAISFHFFPEDWAGDNPRRIMNFTLYPDLNRRDQAKRLQRATKRAMDIAGSMLALAFLSPLLALIALAIKVTSRGPVLFRQVRIGQHGQLFTFLKFRTMHLAADPAPHKEFIKRYIAGRASRQREPEGRPVYKITDDSRVTLVGRLLRKTSLDELPQFMNVLKGEMSLVGPRPPIPYELESYEVWHRRRVLEVKPGITGLWQVTGRSRTKFDDMVRLDLRYARSWSPWLDLKILLKTPQAVFSREGAY